MTLMLKDFHYNVPEELIAQHPCEQRDASRLLVLNRHTKQTAHTFFSQLTDYFQKGDVLVFNDSKVFPCRLITQRKGGGRQEILLLRKIENQGLKGKQEHWVVLINANKKIKKGDVFAFEGFTITFLDEQGAEREVLIEFEGDLSSHLKKQAHIPLPPYIRRQDEKTDHERYQTVFARESGSTAAPTAGLHFTETTIKQLRQKGVEIVYVTLHVGPGTFLPVRVDNITEHKMHTEFFSISQQTCDIINLAKKENRSITAVGTTSTRVLESIGYPLAEKTGSTDIFIYPPYEFKIIDRLITNFHLPESTLLMLVSAFAGRETILATYQEAVKKRYRLFSYGDAMMIG